MIKYFPGQIAAVAAFLAVKLFNWALWMLSVTAFVEILVFLVIYIALTLIIDAAIKRYT